MPTILLIRHGNTPYDKRVDALLDPPLTQEGVDRAKRMVKFLSGRGYKFHKIISSPLQRTIKVAHMLGGDNAKIYPNKEALPWNLGDIMGKYSNEARPLIQHLMAYPDIKAPHGESYRAFYDKWEDFMKRLMAYAEGQTEPIVVVTHSRNMDAIQTLLGDAPVGGVEQMTSECSVLLLAKNGVSDWTYDLIWDGK